MTKKGKNSYLPLCVLMFFSPCIFLSPFACLFKGRESCRIWDTKKDALETVREHRENIGNRKDKRVSSVVSSSLVSLSAFNGKMGKESSPKEERRCREKISLALLRVPFTSGSGKNRRRLSVIHIRHRPTLTKRMKRKAEHERKEKE